MLAEWTEYSNIVIFIGIIIGLIAILENVYFGKFSNNFMISLLIISFLTTLTGIILYFIDRSLKPK